MEVTAVQVKELRDKTNAGFMDCKAALKESGGDVEKAIEFLRKKGMAIAEKKAGRQTSEGVVASCIREDGSAGVLIEVNSETDFVARNSQFKEFVDRLVRFVADAESAVEKAGDLPPECGEWITEAVAKLGENISFRRGVRFELSGPGLIASYIHLGSRVGVLVEVGCGDDEGASNDVFKNLVKDITLQIASASPDYLTREDIPPEIIQKESEIVAATLKKVPDAQRARAIEGKLRKTLYTQRVLMDQIFVRPPSDKTIAKLIEEKAKEIGQSIAVRRFARFQVGE